MPPASVHELRLVLAVDDFDSMADAGHAAYIDEVEVGHRCAGQVRIAVGVTAVAECSRSLEDAGLVRLAPPTVTPFGSTNSRFELPAGLQLTLFG